MKVSTFMDLQFNPPVAEDTTPMDLFLEIIGQVTTRVFPKYTIKEICGRDVNVWIEVPEPPNEDEDWGDIEPWLNVIVESDFTESKWDQELTDMIKSDFRLIDAVQKQLNDAIDEINMDIAKYGVYRINHFGDGIRYHYNFQCCCFDVCD